MTAGPASATTLLQAYAFTIEKESGVGTYGPTSTYTTNYPGGAISGVAPGYDGSPTLPPTEDFHTGTSGPQTASSSVSGGGNSTYGLWSGSGSSSASASYGQLVVDVTASHSGGGDNNSLSGSQAFATARDTFTISGGTGAATFRPTFTIDGSWLNNNVMELQLEFDYLVNNDPYHTNAYRIQGNSSPGNLWYNGGYVSSLPGLTITSGAGTSPSSVTGSIQLSFDVPFTFGASFDLTTALYAAGVPLGGENNGTVNFTSTLTGINILQGGNSVNGFTIQSGSGTQYTAQGVAVPLPAAVWLFGSGLLGLVGIARRKR